MGPTSANEAMTISATIATLLSTVFTALTLMGCAHSPQPEATTTPVPTPTPIDVAALLIRSGEATGALKTFRFQLEHYLWEHRDDDGLIVGRDEYTDEYGQKS